MEACNDVECLMYLCVGWASCMPSRMKSSTSPGAACCCRGVIRHLQDLCCTQLSQVVRTLQSTYAAWLSSRLHLLPKHGQCSPVSSMPQTNQQKVCRMVSLCLDTTSMSSFKSISTGFMSPREHCQLAHITPTHSFGDPATPSYGCRMHAGQGRPNGRYG